MSHMPSLPNTIRDSEDLARPKQRELVPLVDPGALTLALQVQRPTSVEELGDVIYVHGSTFGADLSIFYRFDDHSWADVLNTIGLAVWGFDFAGYGLSERYPHTSDRPVGRMEDAILQLHRVVMAVRARNADRPVALISHSWGGAVAARYASLFPQNLSRLVLFAPITVRQGKDRAATSYVPAAVHPAQSHYALSLWAQYRRFIEDIPRGHTQMLAEAHFQEWGHAFLASDSTANSRMPPSVMTPTGPQQDVVALWSGETLYDASRILAPTLLVRGEWDSVCNQDDANALLAAVSVSEKAVVNIPRATHLMHLEQQRGELYNVVNTFLQRSAT